MESQTMEAPVNADAVEVVESRFETPATETRKSRLASARAYVQSAPRWAMLAVPALIVALGGYAYLQHGSQAGDSARQVAMVAPGEQPRPYLPVGYNPNNGPAYAHANGRAGFGFSMGGGMRGAANAWGNGYNNGND
jgi:hypothetical protein